MQLYLLVPLAPLAASIVVGLFGREARPRASSHWLCILGVGVSLRRLDLVFRDVMAGHTSSTATSTPGCSPAT